MRYPHQNLWITSPDEVESLIKTYWLPMAKLAEKLKIEFEPLPPNATAEEVRKSLDILNKKIQSKKGAS